MQGIQELKAGSLVWRVSASDKVNLAEGQSCVMGASSPRAQQWTQKLGHSYTMEHYSAATKRSYPL